MIKIKDLQKILIATIKKFLTDILFTDISRLKKELSRDNTYIRWCQKIKILRLISTPVFSNGED